MPGPPFISEGGIYLDGQRPGRALLRKILGFIYPDPRADGLFRITQLISHITGLDRGKWDRRTRSQRPHESAASFRATSLRRSSRRVAVSTPAGSSRESSR